MRIAPSAGERGTHPLRIELDRSRFAAKINLKCAIVEKNYRKRCSTPVETRCDAFVGCLH